MKTLKILGIETSCDETAVSLIEVDSGSGAVRVLGNTVHSQIDVHASYGGVFPTLAKREHEKNLIPVLMETLEEADALKKTSSASVDLSILTLLDREPELKEAFSQAIPSIARPDIDYIAVTVGPGLEPALWVGINFARALAAIWNVPLVPCNHMEGHILTALIEKAPAGVKTGDAFKLVDRDVSYPALSLLISGGHTQIILMDKVGSYKIVGETLDDAVGECFDKTARVLGLPYPGGPKISMLAGQARAEDIKLATPLPRPMIASDSPDFSFSGLKTAVLYAVKKETGMTPDLEKAYAREIEDAITDVIIAKMKKAIETYAAGTIVIGGGVIANAHIRDTLERLANECSIGILLPRTDHSTDNALMIALAGYMNREKALDPKSEATKALKAMGTLPLGPRA
ncbi:MAG TPA: tRNA (adenosine(37)-N6)-threonylcarbamoyltransferase complex transferase subunit TsaD [Candidatus Paceibacterota bacterium]|nr:tRNA (adenosine(37)-N6)-threonylcarbamoyltransferase complex transferase subunit TsaD [Candidatus Paceibacterota bacterium]